MDGMPNWRKIKGGATMPVGSWKRATRLLTVHGVQYHRSDAEAFAATTIRLHDSGRSFGLLIEREPDNPNDRNAQKVIGWGCGLSRHIGYVDRVEAARTAERYPCVSLTDLLPTIHAARGLYYPAKAKGRLRRSHAKWHSLPVQEVVPQGSVPFAWRAIHRAEDARRPIGNFSGDEGTVGGENCSLHNC